MSKVSKPNNTRRRHTNSKLGCLNCKRKKIRCDENLPECDNCCRGKKETCLYLSLSSLELNRIRITHSLRNSQNKLLNQNYRLPTSSNASQTPESPKTLSKAKLLDNVLEFRFELSKLPLKIPSMNSYPPIQFNNLTIGDFSSDFKIINDHEDSRSENSPQHSMDEDPTSPASESSVERPTPKPLAYGFNRITTFKKLPYAELSKKRVRPKAFHKPFPGFSARVIRGKHTLLDFFQNFFCKSRAPVGVMVDAFVCLGHVVVLNQMKMRRKYDPDAYSTDFIDKMERGVLERHLLVVGRFERAAANFHGVVKAAHATEKLVHDLLVSLLFSLCFIAFTNLLLDFSAETYVKQSKCLAKIFESHADYIKSNELKPLGIFSYLLDNVQYIMMNINIPLYEPQFLPEFVGNLETLQPVYKLDAVPFQTETHNYYYKRLVLEYYNLLRYLRVELLPVIHKNRDDAFVSTYPPSVLLHLLKKWYQIFPTGAMSFRVQAIPDCKSIEGLFLKDLTVCLYSYYTTLSTVLESLFPAAKYLFSISFTTTDIRLHDKPDLITTEKNNYYHETLSVESGVKCNEFLQRHNYSTARISAFFRNRHLFYQNDVIWKCPYRSLYLSKHRTQARRMKNVLEIPVRSFNTTVIRPEHYPTQIHGHYDILVRDPHVFSIFTREDESMDHKLYTRNVETLDFFNPSTQLQYDFGTKLLLRDYRPEQKRVKFQDFEVTLEDLKMYYVDRAAILGNE